MVKRRQAMSEILLSEESVKLYEYDQSKPELDDEYIEHFGILGMHWGTRNGPPYPLGSDVSTGRRLKKVFGGGSGSDSVSRKRKKSLKKARKTRAKNLKIKTMEKQSKDDIIKNKDIKSMLKYVDKFSNQEINDMLTRLNVEQRLREEVNKQEKAQKKWTTKVKEGFIESAKEGLVSGGKQVTKNVAKNAMKMGTKNLAKKLVGEAKTEGGDPYTDLIEKLFREEKK